MFHLRTLFVRSHRFTLLAVAAIVWPAFAIAQEKQTEPEKPSQEKPAEPATEPVAAPEKAAPVKETPTAVTQPHYSYANLADPRVAAELQLTDEQRAKIAPLLKERADALAKAPDAEKSKIAEQSDAKLAELITAEQKAILLNLKPEPRLRFNFRSQKWAEVLDWFAHQADLSLVLDAPPPGTFNYTDAREFTPTEAIDLLNGVLQTKGYTLIRRKRMLLVVNVTDGVPEGLIPRIPIEDLDQRGRFELVSVMFPLGNRPAEEVAKEITPLLGPHGKAIPLPKTKQLLVTDMAGIMRSVSAIIASIPDPQPPAKPPEPAPPEKPNLVAYPLKSADPNAAIEMLKVLVEPAKAVYDAKSQSLDVFATPTQHAVVKTVLEQLQANNAPDKQPRLETYPLDTTESAQLLETAKLVALSAQMRIDAKTGALVAWAFPDEHEKIKATIDKLGQAGSGGEQSRKVAVYSLTKADPTTTLTLLQGLFPNARLSVDATSRSIVAVAMAGDQERIKTTIDQLQPEKPGPNAAELRFYPFEQTPPASLTSILATLAPRATITPDSDGKRLTVLATPADHEIIKATIDRFVAESGPDFGKERSTLEIYTVTPAQRKRFLAIQDSITAELPGIRVVTSAEPGELAVWAKPSQHEVLKGLLEKLVREVPADSKQQLVAYSIKASDPASAMTLLQQLFPDTRIVVDAKTRRLLVWSRPEEHKLIEAAIEQINSGVSADMLETFRVYPLKDVDPNIAVSMLQQLLPDARLSSDSVAKTVLVWGRKADHTTVEKTLKQMQEASQSKTERSIVVYPVESGDSGAILQTLRSMVPGARIDDYRRAKKIVVWGTPEEQETIRSTIEKVAGADVADAAAEVVVYPVKAIGASAAIPILQSLAPQARYTYGADLSKLVVWASKEDHATIKQVIEKIEAEAKPGDDRVLAVYPLFGANATTLAQVLAPFQTQGAQIVSDATRDCLIIRATKEQQDAIKVAVEELTAKLPQEKKPTSHVYRFQTADPYAAATVLATLTPYARVAVDYRNRSLVVSAVAEDHEKIAKTIAEMDREGDASEMQQMKSYRVESINPATLVGMLQTLFAQYPEVRFAADVPSGTIAVMATPAQHQKVQSVIDEVGKTEQGNTSHVYRFERADPYAALTVLQTMAPNARMAVDSKNRSLVVSASPAEHKKIAETVAQMDNTDDKAGTPVLHSYQLKSADAYTTLTVLQTLFATSPEVRISLDTRNDAIVALASAAQHEMIKSSIDEMESKEQGRTSQVYRFTNADPYAASTVLATLTPRAQFAVDSRNRTLVVSATPSDHAKIKATVEQMESGDKEGQAQQLKSYQMKSADAYTALTVLQTLFATSPEVRISLDARNDTIVALASAAQHEKIKASIDEMESKEQGRTSQVYRFQNADPYAASTVLTTLTPRAQFAVDSRNRTLVVSATPSDHAKIKATVEQMESGDQEGQTPQLKSYSLKSSDPTSLVTMLQTLFATHPEVRFSVDVGKNAVIAIASNAQHETIRKWIDEADGGAGEGQASKIEVYPLKERDPDAVLAMMTNLMARQLPRVDLSIERNSNQLVAVARPDQHALIRGALDQLATEKRELEVFKLDVIEPFAAELAIARLFDSYGSNAANAPTVDSDAEMQQLYVRGTKEQLEEVRKLLVKMGETTLQVAGAEKGKRMRVIPFNGDAKAAVSEIERVWPQLRKNSIRVVVPSAVAPALRQGRKVEPVDDANNDRPKSDESPSQDPPRQPVQPAREPKAQFSVPPETFPATETASTQEQKVEAKSQDSNATTGAEQKDSPAPSPISPGAQQPAEPQLPAEAQPPQAEEPKSPVIISPGDGSITISSDDLEALDQIESLLRAMSRGEGNAVSRDYSVYMLHNASAVKVAIVLQQLLRTGQLSGRSDSRTTIVADERLNAIVVRGGKNDRAAIEELLKVLDTADVPDALATNRPKLIPIKNTEAWRIEGILRDIYKSQLTSGGGRQPIPVPTGVSPQVAAAIQQANATSSGPLLTLGVDELTNSLIIMAPSTLVEEIEKLVRELDTASGEGTSRDLTVIPLKKMNSESMQQVLQMIFSDRVQVRQGSRRPRGNNRPNRQSNR